MPDERWKETFFILTLPYFVTTNRLIKGGSIYLPNVHCIDIGLKEHFDIITMYYNIYRLKDLSDNPLIVVTCICKNLLTEEDNNNNDSKVSILNNKFPFFKLVSKTDYY